MRRGRGLGRGGPPPYHYNKHGPHDCPHRSCCENYLHSVIHLPRPLPHLPPSPGTPPPPPHHHHHHDPSNRPLNNAFCQQPPPRDPVVSEARRGGQSGGSERHACCAIVILKRGHEIDARKMPVTFGYSSPRVKWWGGGGGGWPSLPPSVRLHCPRIKCWPSLSRCSGWGGKGKEEGGGGGVDTPSTKTKRGGGGGGGESLGLP